MPTVRLLRATGDDALARRAARGDHEAFGVLFARYQLRIELYCRSILRHDEDARDAAQNAMTKAYVALQGREQDLAVRAWLFRIAHNESISLMRRRRPTDELRDETLQAAGPAASPDATVELREELAQVLGGIQELAPRARQALLLRELADLDYTAVGQVLGISPGGARQAVFEARTALQADRAGRDAPCESIRRELSEGDHRRRPTRQVRGHLRGCDGCRSWSRAQDARRERLAVLPGAGIAGGSLWAWLTGAFGLGAGAAGGTATISAGSGFALNAKVVASVAALAAGATPVAVHEVERTLRHDASPPTTTTSARADAGAAAVPTASAAAAPTAAPVAASRATTTTTRRSTVADATPSRPTRVEPDEDQERAGEEEVDDVMPRAHQATVDAQRRRGGMAGADDPSGEDVAAEEFDDAPVAESRPAGSRYPPRPARGPAEPVAAAPEEEGDAVAPDEDEAPAPAQPSTPGSQDGLGAPGPSGSGPRPAGRPGAGSGGPGG